jgi:hypothetical protein
MENLLEILATPKQVGLLIGAGVSKACGLTNIDDLTKDIREGISQVKFNELLNENDNVETILTKVQQLKSLITDGKTINDLSREIVKTIEESIKKTLFEKLSLDVPFDNLCNLVIWLNFINREHEKEIFSLNYDLLFEKALEKVSMPYFTGFIGNVKPFFIPDSVDDNKGLYVRQSWIKLWKLHGSLNFKKNLEDKIYIENNISEGYENLLVYPSMDKYLSSRKAPYISYLDRFRKYLLENEKVLIVLGYSFGDDHVNDIIINGLNNNTRLSILVFAYNEETYKRVFGILGLYPNVSIYTEKKKYVNRTETELKYENNIGDFNHFVTILDSLINQKKAEIIKEK